MTATVRPKESSTWYSAATEFDRPQLTFDLDVDVCVIGGGFAGLTAAREVARRGWSVAVVEAHEVAWNASGRNCGFVLPGYAAPINRIVERVGLARAKALWRLSEDGVDYVRRTIRDTAMPGVDPVPGWLDVSKIDNGDELVGQITLLGQEFGAEVEGWPTERVRAVLRTDHYFHAIHYPAAFHINPLNYALGLAADAVRLGARIFENSPAIEIDPSGVRKRIVTPQGRVRADHVVLAGNAHLGSLAPAIAATVMPVATYVAVTEPLGARLHEAVAYGGAISDTRFVDHHYRIVDGDRLMWAGGVSTAPRDLRRIAAGFKAAIGRIYPQLGPVEIASAWSGIVGLSVHRMPQIGQVGPGLWLLGAFGGHGLNTTAMAGEMIARAIVEGDDRWRLFMPFELVWAGGRLGRGFASAHFWARRKREEFLAGLARRREAARRAEEGAIEPPEPAPEPEAPPLASAEPEVPVAWQPDAPETAAVEAGDGDREPEPVEALAVPAPVAAPAVASRRGKSGRNRRPR